MSRPRLLERIMRLLRRHEERCAMCAARRFNECERARRIMEIGL